MTLLHRMMIVAALPGLTSTVVHAAPHLTYEDMLDHLTNLDRLPAVEPGVTCGQFSSYDRRSRYDAEKDEYVMWDANGDSGNYIRIDPRTKEGVMAEMEGPGCVFRIWSANPQGVIRFYLDGDTEPTYEWDFRRLCAGAIEPFASPLAWRRDPAEANSASNFFAPIPYARSCRITSVIEGADGNRTPGHYYIINYRSFPKDWTVDTFKLPLTSAQLDVLQQTNRKWSDCGKAPSHPLDHFASKETTVAPGDSQVVAELVGPAVIRQFKAKLKSTEEWATRKVMLRIYWDGEKTPSVNCPIGDFFGEPKDVPYKSYPMGIGEGMNYCFFPMPFRKSAKVVVTNEASEPALIDAVLAYRKEDIPDNWAYFHAKWRGEIASTSFDYPLIRATGTGKLVGIALFPDNLHGGWWGEGDEKVYVDGEKFPSWFGTGSEDYFGDAWGIRYFEHATHGHPQKTIERMQGCYRWHLADSIPFYRSFYMTIENYTGNPAELKRNDYSSMAYWYQMPGGSDFFTDTPVEDRIPRGYVATGAVEAERYITDSDLKRGMSIIEDGELPKQLSSNRGIRLEGRIGDEFVINVPAPVEEYYTVRLLLAREVPASTYEILLAGEPMPARPYLKEGNNPITIRFTGKPVDGDRCELIVDGFLMEVYRKLVNEWLLLGPFANQNDMGHIQIYPPEINLRFDTPYTGREGQPIRWQRITRPDGVMLLNEYFHPHEELVAYGYCVVHAPRTEMRTLLVGSDDSVKIWISDNEVHSKHIRRGLAPDQDKVEVLLKEGPNPMLVKITQGVGDVGWAVRFLDPADELSYSVPELPSVGEE